MLQPVEHRKFVKRDLAKTISFLALHLMVGFTVAYAFTGSIAIASGIALVEPLVNAVVFFFHERAWRSEFTVLDVLLHRHVRD
nr:DUF2061 domain-containing protein [Porphyrobacter sp. GA68]